MARDSYRVALERTGILRLLQPFDPRVAGTPPLGLDLEASDIDILCHVADRDAFVATVWSALSENSDFRMWQWVGDGRPVLASFFAQGWDFEIFGGSEPVDRQPGWRHFQVEARLLSLGGQVFRDAVMAQRLRGLKTEPAFAAVLRLPGNPYRGLLDLDGLANEALLERLAIAGFE